MSDSPATLMDLCRRAAEAGQPLEFRLRSTKGQPGWLTAEADEGQYWFWDDGTVMQVL